MKASLGHEKRKRTEDGSHKVTGILQGHQEALLVPCEGCELERLLRKRHEFILEAKVPLLRLHCHYLLGERVGNRGTVDTPRYLRVSGVMRGSSPRVPSFTAACRRPRTSSRLYEPCAAATSGAGELLYMLYMCLFFFFPSSFSISLYFLAEGGNVEEEDEKRPGLAAQARARSSSEPAHPTVKTRSYHPLQNPTSIIT